MLAQYLKLIKTKGSSLSSPAYERVGQGRHFFDSAFVFLFPSAKNPVRPRKNTAEGGVGGIPPRPRLGWRNFLRWAYFFLL
jgi:hypothetical protein